MSFWKGVYALQAAVEEQIANDRALAAKAKETVICDYCGGTSVGITNCRGCGAPAKAKLRD